MQRKIGSSGYEDFSSDNSGKALGFQSQEWSVPRNGQRCFTITVLECSWVLFLAALILAI